MTNVSFSIEQLQAISSVWGLGDGGGEERGSTQRESFNFKKFSNYKGDGEEQGSTYREREREREREIFNFEKFSNYN